MTTYTVSNTAELLAAFSQAAGGDVIEMAPGTYDYAVLSNQSFSSELVIRSADPSNPAVLSAGIKLSGVTNVTLENIDVTASAISTSPLVFVSGSSNVSLIDIDVTGHIPTAAEGGLDPYDPAATRGSVIAGYGYGFGIRVHNSTSVDLSGGSVQDVKVGLYVGDSAEITVTDMEFTRLREGIQFFDTSDMTISDNHFHDFVPWLSYGDSAYQTSIHDHSDMIQFWGVNSQEGVHDIVISDNLFEMPPGEATQTIFGEMNGAADGVSATNFTITGNTIINGHPNAIRLNGVDGGVIADNTLLPNAESVHASWAPSIDLGGSQNFTVTDNAMVQWTGDFLLSMTPAELAAANISVTNTTLFSTNSGADDYWGNVPFYSSDTDPSMAMMLGGQEAVLGSHLRQDAGVVTVSMDGTQIVLSDNAWKSALLDVDITQGTVLHFDFEMPVEGEIHAIGFANGDVLDASTLFQLGGSQTFGLQDYNGVYGGGSQSYDIAVGQYFTGSYDRVVFVMDDDAGVGAVESFDDITFSSSLGLMINGTGVLVGSHLNGRQDHGSAQISQTGDTVTLNGNAWKSVLLDVDIDDDTVLHFDFEMLTAGEIHGIGFANGDVLDASTLFQLGGSQTYGLQDYNGVYGGGSQSYDIAVGQYFTGSYDRLVFVMDDDAGVGAAESFGDILLI